MATSLWRGVRNRLRPRLHALLQVVGGGIAAIGAVPVLLVSQILLKGDGDVGAQPWAVQAATLAHLGGDPALGIRGLQWPAGRAGCQAD